MADAAALALYRRLARRLGRRAWRGAAATLRWVQCTADGRLRIGIDPAATAARLPPCLPGPLGAVPVDWVAAGAPARAHAWWRVENLDHSVGPGTLAAVLRSTGADARLYGLTAGHVIGGDAAARFGNRVALACSGEPGTALHGRAHQWAPDLLADAPRSGIDAGLVTLDEAALAAQVDALDWPLGWAEPRDGDALRLLTRQHRLPARVVGRITAPMQLGDTDARYTLDDVLCVDVTDGSHPGDSGAALWDAEDRIVALNIGSAPDGSVGNAIAVPIGRVLAWSGCTPVLRHEPLRGEGRGDEAAPATAPPATLDRACDVLARTMWGEARGEPDARAGMAAVGHVVLNRAEAGRWWGRTPEQVCLHPWQFSCWNVGDPNRRPMMDVTPADALFALARSVAEGLLGLTPAARALQDPTGRATHYHAARIAPPAWTRGATRTVRIGNHLFYRDVA